MPRFRNVEEKFWDPSNSHVSLLYQLLTLVQESCSSSQCKSIVELLCGSLPCAVMHIPRQAQAVEPSRVLHVLFWRAQCLLLEALSGASTAPRDISSRSSPELTFSSDIPRCKCPPLYSAEGHSLEQCQALSVSDIPHCSFLSAFSNFSILTGWLPAPIGLSSWWARDGFSLSHWSWK